MYDDGAFEDFVMIVVLPIVGMVLFFFLLLALFSSAYPEQICVAKNSTVKVDDKYCDYEFDGYHWVDKP